MTRAVRVAVVGTGTLGAVHARVLADLDEAELVGVVDTDADAAARVARKHRTRVLPDLDAVREEAEACVVAVPTKSHHTIASPLLDAGVSCLVEKPLATSLTEAEDLVTRAERGGAVLMVGHVERFNPAVMALMKHDLAPRFLEAQRVSPYSFRSADVGVVLDMMIHDIDLILHLVDSSVASVHAVGIGVVSDMEDLANVRLIFENGAVANVTASRLAFKTERKLRLFAKDCYVSLDFRARTGRIIRPAPGVREKLDAGTLDFARLKPLDIMTRRLVRTETLKVPRRTEPLVAEDQEFLRAIIEDRPPLVPGSHGLRAMQAADQVVRSIRENLAHS